MSATTTPSRPKPLNRRATLPRATATLQARPTTIKTYRAALAWLETLVNYESMPKMRRRSVELGLTRINRILAQLHNPHKNLCCVHVAGTKGKGSTVAMLSHMLSANEFSVGVYTSPHILDIRERITINQHHISEADFTRVVARVMAATKAASISDPTFFEALTAAAFLHFAQKKVDIAVVETGLGGRLDCTNVITKPEVCGITSISLDHTQILGNSITSIAEEKAGIFKSGVTVISAPQTPEVKRVLRRTAAKTRSPLLFAGDDIEFSYRFESSRATGPHTRVSVSTPTSRFEHLAVPLLGEHQAFNCAVALGMLDVLKSRGFEIKDEAAITGLANVHLPGRMEVIFDAPRVMVDGAHNPASVEALMRAIGQNVAYDSMVVVFGCNADKDVRGMLQLLQLGADKIIFTASRSPRACDPAELAAQFAEHSGRMAQWCPTLEEAVHIASKAVTRDDLLCITGSFYLVGEAKQLFTQRERVFQLLR